ncbi:MAG TPA: hypothetical protein VFK10_11285 [Burkholderiaceae bacterium]|nr:hypothetical protein [Burkholderiaceae bacterium]
MTQRRSDRRWAAVGPLVLALLSACDRSKSVPAPEPKTGTSVEEPAGPASSPRGGTSGALQTPAAHA